MISKTLSRKTPWIQVLLCLPVPGVTFNKVLEGIYNEKHIVAPHCSVPSLLFARVFVCIQETQWDDFSPCSVTIAWFMGEVDFPVSGNTSWGLHGEVFPPSLGCRSSCGIKNMSICERKCGKWSGIWSPIRASFGVLRLLWLKKKKGRGRGP